MAKGDQVITEPIEPTRDRPDRLELPADEEALGEGGMATVLSAFDRELGRPLAYKQLHPNLMSNEAAKRSFITEAQVTAQLDHPHVVPVYEMGRHPFDDNGESLYFTMKRVPGKTLAEIIDAKPIAKRTQEELFLQTRIFAKVCDAIAFAHSRGVVHRDIKTENIMVGDFGQVYVLDWGIALIKSDPPDPEPKVMGTPSYMAPEQAKGYADERSDIFSLGACLYELLTGERPYGGHSESAIELLEAALACEIVPPQDRVDVDLPGQLSRVAMKAMSKRPEDRYQTVRELKSEVEKFMQTYSFFPRITFPADTVIVREGDTADAIYVVVDGSAVVVRDKDGEESHVRDLRSGDVFGEVAVFANQPRTATVRAVTELTAVRISREQMSRDNEIGYWFNLFTRALADRFLEKEQQIEALERRLERLTRKVGD